MAITTVRGGGARDRSGRISLEFRLGTASDDFGLFFAALSRRRLLLDDSLFPGGAIFSPNVSADKGQKDQPECPSEKRDRPSEKAREAFIPP